MPIPDLSNKPGPGRPGFGPTSSYDFQFEVSQGQVGILVLPNTNGIGFTVKWQNGTEQFISSGETNLQSPTTDAGIISINKKTDPGFCDDFAVASGQQFVTKVISWGENPWSRLVSAFENCVNLTSVEKTKLYGVNTIMESTFEQCSSLVSADLSELNVSNNISIYRMFKDCTALQFLSIKNDNSKLNLGTLGTAQNQIEAFMNVGSGVSTGCEVIIKDTEFVNARISTTVLTDLFRNVRFKDTSDLSGLSFSGLAFNYNLLFQYAHVTQDNSFLNISNWSFNHTNEWSSQSLFFRFNDNAASGVNTDIDTTGWNFGKVTGLSQWFYYCNIRTIRGLSTWTRDNSVLFVTLFRAFNRWFNAKIPSSDNFSSSFWANSRLSGNQAEMFQLAGSTSIDTETGSFPNLNGLALNATSLIDAFNGSKWNTRIDFTGASQYTGAGQVASTNCQRMFQSAIVIGSDRKILFNIADLKLNTASTLFNATNVNSIDISSVVDFSLCTNFQFMFLNGTAYDGNVTLPTNIDFSSATQWNGSIASNHFPQISFSTCQIDNLIRRIHATLPTSPNSNTNQIYSPSSQVTASPALVQNLEQQLVSPGGYNITVDSTDATLPFAYPSYVFNSNLVQSVTPTTVPTGSQFSTTSSVVTVDGSTGVVTWSAGVGAAATIKCTYTDGCYNEVEMFIVDTVPNSYSMKFDGAIDTSFYFENTSIAVGEPWTMSFWFKRNGTPSSTERFLGGDLSRTTWFSYQEVLTSGIMAMRTVNNVSHAWTNTNVCDNQWHHIVLQRQPYTPANNYLVMRSYVDGVLDKTNEVNDWRYKGTLYNGPLLFIGSGNPLALSFTGHMDEFAVWNSTLTQEEITLIYQAASAGKMANLSSLPTQPDVWFRLGD